MIKALEEEAFSVAFAEGYIKFYIPSSFSPPRRLIGKLVSDRVYTGQIIVVPIPFF